ncbi:hypothetical protein BD293_0040 [Roseinatronobacter monicus]|uniref:Uncharacterized protein n=1 Tax=Roseinatronobacter monicus TaxID=393481 RepID=A0A543K8T6_9RHOB|nr:hypothetical protein BD293_0040 [Roseinatronobacter monicus]
MPSSSGGCWQEAGFAKLRAMVVVLDVPGPLLTVGMTTAPRCSFSRTGHSCIAQHRSSRATEPGAEVLSPLGITPEPRRYLSRW